MVPVSTTSSTLAAMTGDEATTSSNDDCAALTTSPNPETMKKEEGSGQTSKIWDRFADGYSRSKIADEESYQKKIKKTQQYLAKDMNVVEIGCGTGGTSLLHAPYVKHILATDISEKMIDIAKRKLVDDEQYSNIKNVNFQQISIDHLELENGSKDVVLALSILHLLKNRNDAISKINKWLKVDGLFVSSTICLGDKRLASIGTKLLTNVAIPIGNFFGVLPYVGTLTKEQLREDLQENGFTIEYEWQPTETAAVFIIARKTSDI